MSRFIIGLAAVAILLIGTLWFLYDETFLAKLLFWYPGGSHEVSVPPDAAALLRGGSRYDETPREMGKDLSILFVGDTSFGENYQSKSFFESRGYDYFVTKLIPLLNQADVVISNLETPLTNLAESPFSGKKKYVHWGDVQQTPATLKNYGIRFASLANNHTMDYGPEGLLQTLQVLKENNMAWFGAGLDASDASEALPLRFTIAGIPFHLVVAAGFEYEMRYDFMYRFYARENGAGVNRWTSKDAAKQIRNIRQANRDAFIVAFPHWGSNYRFRTKDQIKTAHTLIDAGSDLVIGHGAHIMQEIEHYKNRWIVYGLGNFVFNSPGRYQDKGVEPFSMAARLDVTNKGGLLALALRLYPVFSDNRISGYQPRLVTREEMDKVIRLLRTRSPDPEFLGKQLRIGEDEIGRFVSLDIMDITFSTFSGSRSPLF